MKKYLKWDIVVSSFVGATAAAIVGVPVALMLKANVVK